MKDIVRHVGNVQKEGCDGGTQPPEQTCRLLSTLTEMPLTLHLWSALSWLQVKNGYFSGKSYGLV